jgi:DnaJ-class molecular chaperone
MDSLSPFAILGIEETDNRHIVTSAYRRMILMVHPDKAGKLGWSPEECTEAFQQIKSAYQTIMRDYNFSDAPDYDILYSMDNIDSIDNTDFKKFKNLKEFNKQFELNKNKDDDPYTVGYKDFGRTKQLSDEALKRELTKDYGVTTSKKYKKREITKFKPQVQQSNNNCYEFGLTNVDDFGFASNSKTSNTLSGSDISQVHENNEPWEMSVSRNKQLVEKYNNTKSLDSRLSDYMSERDSLNIDSEVKKSEQHFKQEIKTNRRRMEKIRSVQNQRDLVSGMKFINL